MKLKDHIYRMVIVEGCCTKLTSSSLHTYIIIGWHKSIVSSDWSDTMVWFGQILLYLTFHILYTWSLSESEIKYLKIKYLMNIFNRFQHYLKSLMDINQCSWSLKLQCMEEPTLLRIGFVPAWDGRPWPRDWTLPQKMESLDPLHGGNNRALIWETLTLTQDIIILNIAMYLGQWSYIGWW